ncbi:MAG: hypothetical protein PF549_00535 [Patescibacteria group bacterium]|jgi:lipopolysaccharide export system protein LptC|nr:hypothetical protein [Patescibacteria group bacterium]
MKNTIILSLIVSVIMIFSVPAYAENEEIIKPSKDTSSIIGKTIEFTDPMFNPRGSIWYFPIIGAQKYQHSMEQGVILFVPCNVFYYSQRVKFIIYSSRFNGTDWHVIYEGYDKNTIDDKIKVISIQ